MKRGIDIIGTTLQALHVEGAIAKIGHSGAAGQGAAGPDQVGIEIAHHHPDPIAVVMPVQVLFQEDGQGEPHRMPYADAMESFAEAPIVAIE